MEEFTLTYKYILLTLGIVYAKWIVIFLVFPLQVANNHAKRFHWWKYICLPYILWEKLFRHGWERYMLYHVSTIPSCHIRKWIYKSLGSSIERKVVFHFKTEIRCPYKLRLGEGTIIGDSAILDARSGLDIGKNVNLSSNVSIYTLQHDHRDPYFKCTKNSSKSVKIHDRAWLGSHVIVLPGVTIGEGAVCCAGSVVTKNVEPYTVVAGIPAKKVNERPTDLKYSFRGKSCRLY